MLFGLLAAAAAAAQQPRPSTTGDADLRCMVAISYALATVDGGEAVANEEERSGLVALIMYYVGKIDGRMPGFDYGKEVAKLIQSPDYAESGLLNDLDRCGDEAEERGRVLQELGEQLEDLAPLLEGGRTG